MSEWILLYSGPGLYLLIALLLLGGAIGLPIPEDLPLVASGALIYHGKADVLVLFLVSYLAIVGGDVIIYLAGRTFGAALFKLALFQKRFPESEREKVKKRLEKHAFSMIIVARHLFYLRTLTFLTCGAVRINFMRYLIIDAAAALISVPLMMFLGYCGAEHLPVLFEYLSHAKVLSFAVGVLLLAVGVFLIFRQQRRDPSQTSSEGI